MRRVSSSVAGLAQELAADVHDGVGAEHPAAGDAAAGAVQGVEHRGALLPREARGHRVGALAGLQDLVDLGLGDLDGDAHRAQEFQPSRGARAEDQRVCVRDALLHHRS
jgi:hypothetical protein